MADEQRAELFARANELIAQMMRGAPYINSSADAPYGESWDELEALYLGYDGENGHEPPEQPLCPRYVLVRSDETYSLIDVCETLDEALTAAANCCVEGTLNVPGRLVDLDTNEDLNYTLRAELT
jgi:hypothetical protein